MPKREFHVMIVDDGETVELKLAHVVAIGGTDVVLWARQCSMLSLPEDVDDQWRRDMAVRVLEEL